LQYFIKSSNIKISYPPGGRRYNMNDERKKALQSLKTSKGQIEGIIKMIEDGRYCIDISNQIIAAQSLLKKANILILKQHLNHCVKDAFINNTGEEKVDEIIDLLSKLMKD
jgi:CsoR family transcriptional regulator, copper-sensing transcriptional repressor